MGRPLDAACWCDPDLTADEQAMLLLLSCGSADPAPSAPPAVPHGLPGAQGWAVRSARRLLDFAEVGAPTAARRCPFAGAEMGEGGEPNAVERAGAG